MTFFSLSPHERLLKDFLNGETFTTQASMTPNANKLEYFISTAFSKSSINLASLMQLLEKKIIKLLPESNIWLILTTSSTRQKIIHDATLYDIRKCGFYVNIMRGLVNKCKSVEIFHLIHEYVARVIVALLQQSHEEFFKLFFDITLDYLHMSNDVDFSPVLIQLLKVCKKQDASDINQIERRKRAFTALYRLFEVSVSRQGLLEVYYEEIFSVIMDNLDVESFYIGITQLPSHVSAPTPRVGKQAALEGDISDICLLCLKLLSSTPSQTSLTAFLNSIISYFDEYGWVHQTIAVEVILCLNLTALEQCGIALPTIQYLIEHANYIATTELAQNITEAEKKSIIRKKSKHLNINTTVFSGPAAAQYVESILNIACHIIVRESEHISQFPSEKFVSLQSVSYQESILKNLYNLTHLLWMVITWKTFYINLKSSKPQPHDLQLSPIDSVNVNYPALRIDDPYDSDIVPIPDNDKSSSFVIPSTSNNPMSGIVAQVWLCIHALATYKFPTSVVIRSKVIPVLLQVLQEKVEVMVETPGVRMDLLIPAKNAMFVYILHAVDIILAYRVEAIVDGCRDSSSDVPPPLTADAVCEFALLLKSRSWQTQKLTVSMFCLLFASLPSNPSVQVDSAVAIRAMENNPYRPYEEMMISIVRDAVFSAVCSKYTHQAHSIAALFQLQAYLIQAFGDEEVVNSLPMVLALEEFWIVFQASLTSSNLQNLSPISQASSNTSNATSSNAPGLNDHSQGTVDGSSLEMLRCMRWFYLAYFLLLSKRYSNLSIEKLIAEKVGKWRAMNGLSKYLNVQTEDSSQSLLFLTSEAHTNYGESGIAETFLPFSDPTISQDIQRVLLQNSKIKTSPNLFNSLRQAFEVQYRPHDDPFAHLQDLQGNGNLSKSLFNDETGSVSHEDINFKVK